MALEAHENWLISIKFCTVSTEGGANIHKTNLIFNNYCVYCPMGKLESERSQAHKENVEIGSTMAAAAAATAATVGLLASIRVRPEKKRIENELNAPTRKEDEEEEVKKKRKEKK